MKQNENIYPGPRYAVRLGDLRAWHVLVVSCFACRHRAELRPERLAQRFGPQTFVVALEKRLRCKRCGNRLHNSWAVERVRRD
ncbi:MAG: hypothetical protein R3F55_10960 [Alphaproteobacteria bacterium]